LCWQAGVTPEFWSCIGDAYVWRSRNGFAHKFLHESKAKYLIFIDSDHGWDVVSFANLLKHKVDVVGAAYPCKNNWDFWGVKHHIVDDGSERPLQDPDTGLISAVWVPTGFMKISREAFEKIEAMEPDNYYMTDNNEKVHGFFNHIVENGTAFGEDISFCVRLQRAGVPLWIEPDINIEHYGVEAHKGNYSDFLRRQPGGDLCEQP
jgi:GT2 family glycosyltransferase